MPLLVIVGLSTRHVVESVLPLASHFEHTPFQWRRVHWARSGLGPIAFNPPGVGLVQLNYYCLNCTKFDMMALRKITKTVATT